MSFNAPMPFSRIYIAIAGCLIMLASCATPVPPSGGPVDRTPPAIVSLEPESGSVNVDRQSVRIEFSEWVDQRSFENALNVTPEPPGDLEFRWRRRSVEVTFPEELLPNTTYVLTIDTEFRDFGGTRLTAPINIAFSTGPTINRGRLTGLVVEPERGRPVAGIDVYAYRGTGNAPPASLPARPDYRTQTADDGRFEFEYLSESPFFVVAVEDVNRNRRVDPGEAFAVPPVAWLVADSMGTDVPRPWVVTTLDSVPPAMTRVRPLSNQRLEIRYNEPVQLLDRDPDDWLVQDSASGFQAEVADVYSLQSEPRNVYLMTEDVLPARPHILSTGAVADSSGNVNRGASASFAPPSNADTTSLRFTGFVPDTTAAVGGIIELDQDQMPGVRFSTPLALEQLRSLVTASDTAFTRTVSQAITDDGTTYGLVLDPPLEPGDVVTITVSASELPLSQRFRRIAASETGEITGVVATPDTLPAPTVIELYEPDATDPIRVTTADEEGAFIFAGIPGGSYRLRLFVDEDGSGTWSGGRIRPFRNAEPVNWWDEDVTVRPRWETMLPDTLSFVLEPPPTTQLAPSP